MFSRLDAMVARLEVLNRMLMDPDVVSDVNKLRELSTEHAHVSQIVEAYQRHREMEAELEGAREMLSDESDAEMREIAPRAEASTSSSPTSRRRTAALQACSCCREGPLRGPSASYSRSGPAPAVTRPPCSLPTCSACTSGSGKRHGLKLRAAQCQHASTWTVGGKTRGRLQGSHRVRVNGRQRLQPASASRPASTGSSAFQRPSPRAVSTPRPPRSPSSRNRTRSRSRSKPRTCASTSCAQAVRVVSRSTRPTRPCASCTSPPASPSSARTRSPSTRTRTRRCGCSRRVCST